VKKLQPLVEIEACMYEKKMKEDVEIVARG